MRAQRRRPRGRPQRQGLRRCFRRPRVTKGRGWDAASPAAFRGDTALSIRDGWLPPRGVWCVVTAPSGHPDGSLTHVRAHGNRGPCWCPWSGQLRARVALGPSQLRW